MPMDMARNNISRYFKEGNIYAICITRNSLIIIFLCCSYIATSINKLYFKYGRVSFSILTLFSNLKFIFDSF